MRTIALGTVLFSVALAATLAAQTPSTTTHKPDFTGSWVMIHPALGAGSQQVVQQTDKTLTVTDASQHEGGGTRKVYNFDGTETKSSFQSHGVDIVTVSKAEWKNDRLHITSVTNYPHNGNRLDQTFVWYLDAKGQLIVDLTQQSTSQPFQSTQMIYRRK